MLRIVALLILLLGSAGCARLPDYARPAFHTQAGIGVVDSASFGYRTLTIGDFQATTLPGEGSGYNHNIQARSCISIRPAADTQMRITNNIISGKQVYLGHYSKVSFEAVFNPSCSWWNPKVAPDKVIYVLQHEQIHFALTELSARQMDSRYTEGILGYLAIGPSYQEVKRELVSMLKSVAHKGLKEEIATHTAFDEQTSLYYDELAQQRWYRLVMKQLNDPR